MSASKLLFVWLVLAAAVLVPNTVQPAGAAVTGETLGALCPETGFGAALQRRDSLVLDGRIWQRLETRLNSFTPSRQDWPTIGLDGDGRFWTAWQSRRQEVVDGVYGRCLDQAGRFLSNEVHLNLFLPMSQGRPVAVPDSQGSGGWVAWESAGQDGHLGGLYARRFGRYLDQGGAEIRLNSITEGEQTGLAACRHGRGGLAAAWTGPGDDGESTLFLRFFDAAGRPLSDERPVGVDKAPGARTPAICTLPSGGVALAWTAFSALNRPDGIFLQRFGPDGVSLGEACRVSSGSDGWRDVEPALALLADDSLVLAWPSAGADGDDYGILARIIDPAGTPRGPVFQVNDLTTGLQNGPAIAADPRGGFAVLWNHFDSLARDAHVRGRFFTGSGAPRDAGFRLASGASDSQRLQVAAGRTQALFSADGSLAVCWSGNGGLGDENGAYLTLLVPQNGTAASSTPEWQEAYLRRLEEKIAAGPGSTGTSRQAEPVVMAVEAAKPHVPPVYDPKTISRDPYGGDRSPFPLADEGFIAVTNTGWGPPDPHLAVGPNHVVAMVNGAIAFLDKAGNRLFQDEIEGGNGFWGSVGATSFVFDPEVVFDPHDQRFIAMACEDITGSSSYFLLAVSDDADPEGTWYKYRIDATAYADDFLDSGNLAVDADAVYLTGDVWTSVNYMIYILDKAPLLTGAPAVITNTLTITGTQSHGIPVIYGNAPAMYMIEHFESSSNNSVRLHAITDPLGSPNRVTATVTVPAYGRPSNPPQMGTSTRPEMFDARFWHCVWRNGSLWAAHHAGNPIRARWYQIATNGWPAGGTPSLVQSGEIDPGPDIHTFFNSITVDALGNAATCFARSASDEYISMSRATRLAADPAGTMAPPVMLKESSGTSGSRWGDYSTVAVDPADGVTFWAHHEYAPSSNNWNTWAASFQAGGGAAVPLIAAGPGPGPNNPPEVRLFSAAGPGTPLFSYAAYGVSQFGVNVAAGDIDGDGVEEIVTGPGPGAVFGPHVRAWEYGGTPIAAVSFLAYGTNKFGVNVACGDIDGDGIDEIVTGAGPGAVFGPHVRAWNYDGGTLEPVSGVSYFAYGTNKFGVNVACGDIDGDGFDEIITGAGPGTVFGPHVRGWNYDGGVVTPMAGVSYLAYGTSQFGVNVACGDLDGDGDDEIVSGPGPGVVFGAHVRGWDVAGGTAAALPGVSFTAYPGYLYGARVGSGDLDGDGMDEILTAPGPEAAYGCLVRGWNVDGGTAAAITGIDFDAFGAGVTHGGTITVVDRP
jgi:hypothetical protein